MNDMNSIAGIDDFASEMKRNLSELAETREKLAKCVAYLKALKHVESDEYPFSSLEMKYDIMFPSELLEEIGDD